ncbi:hypothetical protein DEO72_LG10g2408 [Vigna unguiculata]|uniref:Uncharacterized protein n=1 Tax=Vigna unguiculata TaxID=3917 RepID=A0A4D6NG77_VIGUN|nr:hypothetical protein DEO72_LG10g2408 [Vigna unguiculata]
MMLLTYKLETLKVSRRAYLKEKSLESSRAEVARLNTEVVELRAFHDQIKEKDDQLLAMTTQVKELENEKKTWLDKEKELLNNLEFLKDQIGSSLNMGFQLALDQVRIFYPEADLSQADVSKSIIDGQLVETEG